MKDYKAKILEVGLFSCPEYSFLDDEFDSRGPEAKELVLEMLNNADKKAFNNILSNPKKVLDLLDELKEQVSKKILRWDELLEKIEWLCDFEEVVRNLSGNVKEVLETKL